MSRFAVNAGAGLFLVLLLSGAYSRAAPDLEAPSRTTQPVRVQDPPRIDGVLDDPQWKAVIPITDFRQTEPEDGVPTTERSEVYICYDPHNLYFGIRAWDSEPHRLVRSVNERDGYMPADDSILIAIDSNNDNRTAFVFEMNTVGAQTDFELSEQGSFNIDWDAIWKYEVRVDDEGYTIEAAIPFFVLRFSGSENLKMGLLLKRRIRKNNEDANWPYLSRDFEMAAVSQYGKMVGLNGVQRGKHIELKPYAIGGFNQESGEWDAEADAGLDAKWGISSGLTSDLTVNPDFAQVESDALRVNLTRFSLFYPEKRDFFLESANLFQFGLPQRAEVFFSRRIGLNDGQEIPILAGVRGYGLAGRTNLGLLTMQTRDTDGFPGENFTVGRVKQNVLGKSYVGGIITSRQGDRAVEDISAGGDFMFLFQNNVRFHGLLAKSGANSGLESSWFGSFGGLQMTDRYNWEFRYDDIGRTFDPGVGFVMRPDQRTVTLWGQLTPRPGWEGVRQVGLASLLRRIENHDGILETQTIQLQSGVSFKTEDLAAVEFDHTEDLVEVPFLIAPGVWIPAGRFINITGAARMETSPSRRLSAQGDFRAGSFYGGTIKELELRASVRPTSRARIDVEEELARVGVESGAFTSSLSRLFLSYYLSPRFSTRIAAQYSSLYKDSILNFRIRWIYAPGSEIWFVYNEGRQFDLPGSSLQERAVILKIVHNFNF